jgi:hypothetical protein
MIRFGESGYRIVVAEQTRSETVFSVPALEAVKLIPYKDKPVRASVLILKRFDGTRAEVAEVEGVALRRPDPLRPAQDSRFTLKKKKTCVSQKEP